MTSTPRTPGLDDVLGSPDVGDDGVQPSGGEEREKRASMPFRAVEDRDDLLARGSHLALDLHLLGVEIEQTAVEADASHADEALVDSRAAQNVARRIADDGHCRQAEHPARHEHVDAGRIGKGDRIEQAVGDDDDLALLAQLERQVIGGRARVERNRLPVSDHRRRRSGDRALLGRLEMKPNVEGQLRLATLEPADATAHAGDKPLAGELREIVRTVTSETANSFASSVT